MDQTARTAALEPLNAFIGEWSVERGSDVPAGPADGRAGTQRVRVAAGRSVPDGLYAMTFDGGVWTLLRTTPDFTPLAFSQRFTGTFADDGDTIRGAWATSPDGSAWEKDFDLTYTRIE